MYPILILAKESARDRFDAFVQRYKRMYMVKEI